MNESTETQSSLIPNTSCKSSSNNDDSQNDQSLISQQKIQEYVEKIKKEYDILLSFLENSEEDKKGFENLINIINNNIQQDDDCHENFKHFLHLLADISNNHHRDDLLFKKIYQILEYYQNQIKQTFSNLEIFDIFIRNKKMLLFLFESKILFVDENVFIKLISIKENGYKYSHFFYTEIKEFIGEEKSQKIKEELISIDSNIFDYFDKKRHEGENDSNLCLLIRNDSIEDFISHVNKEGISMTDQIMPSLFETNPFLIENQPTLIEYSAFFGSIQIFKYLRMQNVKISPYLLDYAIHSLNPELIYLLENEEIKPCKKIYEDCYIESIKCHHNDTAYYFKEKYDTIKEEEEEKEEAVDHFHLINYKMDCDIVITSSDRIFEYSIRYHNYEFFKSDFVSLYELFCLCKYNYYTLANLVVEKNKKNIETIKNDKYRIDVIYLLLMGKDKIDDNFFKISNFFRIAIPNSITSIGNKAFERCLYLKEIAIPNSITSIGNKAFNKCDNLLEITIPFSVISIGDYAFSYCSSLKQIIIPSSVISIGSHVFSYCSSLKQIIIPSSVTSIGSHAFSYCSSLKQIIIPSSVTSIGEGVFAFCYNLDKITVLQNKEEKIKCYNDTFLIYKSNPESKSFDTLLWAKQTITNEIIPQFVNKIGDYTFCECTSLTQISIPSSVNLIGSNVFNKCTSLAQISIPSSVTNIGDYSFCECTSLTQVTIPSSVTSIGSNVFNKCTSLTQISIPSSVTSIGDYSFCECTSLTQVTIPSSVTSIGSNVFNKCTSLAQISIPSSVTNIGDYSFCECTSLTQVAIPSSVTSIGSNVFNKCTSLAQISIPSSVTNIGDYSFCECTSLTQVTIPSSVTSIGSNVFNKCTSLTQISIPSSVTSIGSNVFNKCTSLRHISIPSFVTSVGDYAFYRCTSLTQIVIPSSVTSIGDYAFCGCSSLTQIVIPSSVTSFGNKIFDEVKSLKITGDIKHIPNRLFEECSTLKKIDIPSSVTSIGSKAFSGCSSLSKIAIPLSVTSIGSNTFSGCSALTEITIPSSVTSIGSNTFSGCSALTEITIPSSVTSIEDGTFYQCTSLKKITIPSSVTSIGSYAFNECIALKQITIPSSVISIGDSSFCKCTSLTTVTIPSSVKKVGILTFLDCTSLTDASFESSQTSIGEYSFLGCPLLNTSNSFEFANIDDYEINELIAKGGYAYVFKVTNKKTGKIFALNSYESNSFKNHLEFMEKVIISNNPGIVKVHGFRFPLSDEEIEEYETLNIEVIHNRKQIKCDLTNYILICEYIENGNLLSSTLEYLKDQCKMNPTIRSKIIYGIASIMKHLHNKNIILHDLKLEKILLDENFEPKINCFTLSRFINCPMELEMAIGTPLYMAPETYMDGFETYGFPVDVFSFAIVLLKMFSNMISFPDHLQVRSKMQYMMLIGRGLRPERPEGIPDHYWELIQKCWDQNPNNRPSFDEITNILKNDKFALDEFGMKTDLEMLHEYQQRIDKI